MDGYSGSDVRLVCREAAMRPVRKIFDVLESHQEGGVTHTHTGCCRGVGGCLFNFSDRILHRRFRYPCPGSGNGDDGRCPGSPGAHQTVGPTPDGQIHGVGERVRVCLRAGAINKTTVSCCHILTNRNLQSPVFNIKHRLDVNRTGSSSSL